MESFYSQWAKAAEVSFGLFWMAFWAFGLGYVISSLIQVFVTRERMRKSMGTTGPKSVALGTFFGFVSSSCSFAALSTTRALFAKGAGLIPSLSFLLASTNLVIELGIIISIFLSWQFVVGEYIGGLILILLVWLIVRLTKSESLEKKAREKAQKQQDSQSHKEEMPYWKNYVKTKQAWKKVAHRYWMEWGMVWKDVTIGFTVAGIVASFVPRSFFQSLFVGSEKQNPAFWELLIQSLVGPVAAFFTFIGSMGNIPLAAVLFSNGVSFAGIMAFIFSDLVVFPVLRIQSEYYGWKMAFYILAVFLLALVSTAMLLHYGFSFAGILPDAEDVRAVTARNFFKVDHTLFLNSVFIVVSIAAFFFGKISFLPPNKGAKERTLQVLASLSFVWLALGTTIWLTQ